MMLSISRRRALLAAVLVLPLLLSAVALVVPHEHHCAFDKECLACRWTADTVTEITPPVTLVDLNVATSTQDPVPEPIRDGAFEAASSRGPPPSA